MTEVVDTLRSVHLLNERPIWIRPPRARASAESLTVFLDGELYRDHVGAVSVLDALGSEIADSWFVFVSMATVEARWTECPCYPPFAKFIVEELLSWLELQFPETKTIRQRVLIGLSYTGLAAAFVAMQYPGTFQKVISQSGSFWWNDCWLAERFRAQPSVPTEFYLDVGTREVHENVRHREDVLQVVSQIEGVRQFRDALRHTGHSVFYAEFEGGHDFAAWKQALPDALRWARPNKAPEPTTTSVTSRAPSSTSRAGCGRGSS
jgi:enterochelin esterase-like enzyme